ncbi:hypothetical protein ACJQWY_06525 [Weissella kandleri]|uniref:hypothetical protein n=1 Tax=Weissella kandleri TaxID=1616 RepID=UPI00387EE0FA
MNVNARNKESMRSILKKTLVTLIVLIVFFMGRLIPLYGISIDENYSLFAMQSRSLLSLGMTPGMTAMILWRIFTLGKDQEYQLITENNIYRVKMLLMLVIATIQSLGLLTQLQLMDKSLYEYADFIILNTIILITGAFFSQWLSNVIYLDGLGGNSVLVAATILGNYIPELKIDFLSSLGHSIEISIIFIIVLIVLLFIINFIFFSEYRMYYRQILSIEEVKSESYIPIKIIPAMGMPFMYALSLFTFVKAFLLFLFRFNKFSFLKKVGENLSLSNFTGVILLSLLIFIISIGFAFFNIDTANLSKRMEENGDYFNKINPGRDSYKFINSKVLFFGIFGALFNVIITVIPLILGNLIGVHQITVFGILGGTILIILSIFTQIFQQITVLYRKYKI